MSRTRIFKKLSIDAQKIILHRALNAANNETDEMKSGWRTDVYGIAMQYYGRLRLRKKDFEMIENEK